MRIKMHRAFLEAKLVLSVYDDECDIPTRSAASVERSIATERVL